MFVTRAKGNFTFWIFGHIMPLTPLSTLKSTWWIHLSSEPRASLQIHIVCTLMGQSLTTDTVSQMFPTLLYLKRASSVQSLSCVWLFVTPWITARQASLSIINSQSSPRLTSIESVMPSSHLILCRPLLLLPPVPPIIRVFSNESTLGMRWPKYWSFSFSIIPSKEIPGLISQWSTKQPS